MASPANEMSAAMTTPNTQILVLNTNFHEKDPVSLEKKTGFKTKLDSTKRTLKIL